MRLEIAGKLKEGVSFEHILDSIRDAGITEEGFQRLQLLDRTDLRNIMKEFHIDYDTKHHENDAVSVTLWVEKMKMLGKECPVLFYKPQNIECESSILNPEDFALVIMTSFQSQQLLKFGHEKICIDGTHGTNSYDFQLYTVMTVDEFGSG
ncbi:hypothetical protein PPYR_02402 [Photinus pyralis]|uniref:Uncharacterized protein n=2 Tax=Photinus pyralis TaxID=7054 RepID=A0A5N4B755_PHOPY|nr:hypothetical protein PPYR_02402 [Photinus pyralis]